MGGNLSKDQEPEVRYAPDSASENPYHATTRARATHSSRSNSETSFSNAFPDDASGSKSHLKETMTDKGTVPSVSKEVKQRLNYLLGNTDKLAASAQKLFAMGKIYFSGNSKDLTQSDGFPALFQALPQNRSTELTCKKGETANHEQCHDHDDNLDVLSSPNSRATSSSSKLSNVVPGGNLMARQYKMQCVQTYLQWKASHDLSVLNYFCFTPPKTIYLQPLDIFPDFVSAFELRTQNVSLDFFEMLQGFMQIFFYGMEVLILPPVSIQGMGWKIRFRYHDTTKHEQYCVTDIFPRLQTVLPKNGYSIVGVMWTDLYPENYNFVLGEASYAHKSAVVSFGRFETKDFDASTHQDISEINGRIIWKFLRTISHELCHLFGFSHCEFFRCAMNESLSVDEALSQPLFLCPVCLRKLQQACGFDVLERYHHLLKFLQSINNQFSDSVQIQNSVTWLESCVDYLTS